MDVEVLRGIHWIWSNRRVLEVSTFFANKKSDRWGRFFYWRRGRDSNPR